MMASACAEPALPPVSQLAALLQAYQHQLMRLDSHVDLGWRDSADLGALERNVLLRARLGLAPVAPAAFTPPAHRLALLEKPQLLQVLAARALYAHRVALCRCVDGAVLARLRGLVGAHALSALRDAGADADGEHHAVAGLPGHLTLQDWAMDGYRLFDRDGAWSEPSLRRLIQLALPAGGGDAHGAPNGDSADLIALLPTLFPELTWLFG